VISAPIADLIAHSTPSSVFATKNIAITPSKLSTMSSDAMIKGNRIKFIGGKYHKKYGWFNTAPGWKVADGSVAVIVDQGSQVSLDVALRKSTHYTNKP